MSKSTREQFAEYIAPFFGVNTAQAPEAPEPTPPAYPVLHDAGEPINRPSYQDPVEDLRERLYNALAWNPCRDKDGWTRIY